MKSKEYYTESGITDIREKRRFVFGTNIEGSKPEVEQIKNQNLLLKQLIAQLSHENQLLKKRLFDTGKPVISKDKCA